MITVESDARYKCDPELGDGVQSKVWHRDNVPWDKAPKPRRWHRCGPQTAGYVDYVRYFERCACGGLRMSRSGGWTWKNERTR